jgi:protein-S-isoprenylcysteine O-methyltransferase Ste14
METTNNHHNPSDDKQLSREQHINYLGSFPPMVQFGGLILGVFMEFILPTKLFPPMTAKIIGTVLVVLATIIILWSQKASAEFRAREKKGEARNFRKGPYRWSDNPTSFSLAMLIIGFGFIVNSLMIVALSAIAYWISYIVYEEKKQKIMMETYKEEYIDYKKKINSLF